MVRLVGIALFVLLALVGAEPARASCVCVFGCECGDPCLNGCPKENTRAKTCDQNAREFVDHLVHRIHHRCSGNSSHAFDQVFACGWGQVRKDFNVALEKRGVTRGSTGERCLLDKLRVHRDVVAKIDAIASGGGGSCICAFGCECGDPCLNGCPKANTRAKTCAQNVADFRGHFTHRLHHQCRQSRDADQAFECGWAAVRRDFNVALGKRGVSSGSAGERCLRDALRRDDDVKTKLAEIGAADPKMIAGNRQVVDPDADRSITETCDAPSPRPAVPPGHYVPPAALVEGAGETYNDPPGKNIGSSEGRLRKEVRDAAARADPLDSLRLAAVALAARNTTLGNAYADLAVTGRRSLARFRAGPPTEATIAAAARARGATDDVAALTAAARTALDRAYRVAYVVRAGGAIPRTERTALGYIAVSGEDDKPAWPVNVPSTPFPQYELVVDVKTRGGATIPVRTRFMIAESKPSAGTAIVDPGARALPTEPTPRLGNDAEVLLYVHGMDSRLEEAVQMAHALHQLAKPGKHYVMISMDLPTSGYADSIDHTSISPLSALGSARDINAPIIPPPPIKLPIPGVPPIRLPVVGSRIPDFDAHGRHDTPVLDLIEDFIVAFVETLDRTVPVKTKIRAVIGGSLGGNMALRLGRRGTPWIKNVVSWSPASIWDSLADGADLLKHFGVRTGWDRAGGDPSVIHEQWHRRREFFGQCFEPEKFLIINLVPAQPEMWWRDSWACYPSAAVGARLERQEIYDPRFRLWHWRLGAEQLLFSHQTRGADSKPLFRSNKTPMLLGCGTEDDFRFTNICSTTQKTAEQMIDTPGKARFLKNTGHSIHNERPVYWTREILRFLER